MKYKASVKYCGIPIVVEADTFKELHAAISGILELERDVSYLEDQGEADVRPVFRITVDGHKYYGVTAQHGEVSHGQAQDPQRFELFPKGADGYYRYG